MSASSRPGRSTTFDRARRTAGGAVTAVAVLAALAATALATASSSRAAPPPADGVAETLILFDAGAAETPESIVFDRIDRAYVTLSSTGEIVRVTDGVAREPFTVLPLGIPCDVPRFTVLLGLAIDRQDRLYVAANTCDPDLHGIWKVSTEDGTIEQIVRMPATVVANGIDVDHRWIYIADTFGGRVWRAPKLGGGAPEVWSDDPLLARPPEAVFPGPNGLRLFRGEVYVANSETGDIVAVPILADGGAGTARVHATLPAGQGCDEFAFDVHGRIYCTTDPFNTVVRLDPDGGAEILLTAGDLLDGPTSVAFGRRGTNRENLYITNAAFPIFTTTFRPSLMRLRVGVPGAP